MNEYNLELSNAKKETLLEKYFYIDGLIWEKHQFDEDKEKYMLKSVSLDENASQFFVSTERFDTLEALNAAKNKQNLKSDPLVELKVTRYEWEINLHGQSSSFNFRLDRVLFKDGDPHDVFSIQTTEKPHNSQDTVPAARSKIMEYLFRYDRERYDNLLEKGLVLDCKYDHSVAVFPEDSKKHLSLKGFTKSIASYYPFSIVDSDISDDILSLDDSDESDREED